MKTKFKSKLLSILLVLVMVLALVPFSSITALAVTNGTGTQQSPLTVTTYEELKAALADNTTQYIVVNDFETNYDDGNGGFYQINQAIAEDYALYSNPAVDKHLTINTAVRISTSAQCTNVKTGLEVGGNLTIDGTGIFNMSFYDTESRCVVVNVPKSGKLIVNGQVTIDATSVRHSNEINQEAESIHSKGHIVFNGGTFIGYFSRVSSTMGSVCAVYVEAGRSEYYGGNFKTVNHSAVDNGVQIDKGCEGGVILINRPSANGTKKVPELTKLKGGTFQSIVIVNYEDTSDVIGNLLVGCRLYDADDKHELDDYYALNYVHNATVLKYNLDITFDANGGKGVMNKVTFNTLSNDYFTLPESGFYAPTGKRFKCWSIDGIEKAVGETFEPTKDTVISALWVDIPANELGGKGTKESPLYVNTYAELKAALADDVTEYIIVKDFLYTNDGGYHLINNPIDGEDYALWSNPDIHKHLTIDTKVRLGVYLACPNITKGIEVAGKLTIDGSGSFNTSFLSNKRGTVINVTSTGTLIVEDPVTIDATSIWHTEQHNIEAEAIHSKGHLTINGGTFKGHFDRVSSTSVTLNAVYVEAGKAEFYGGDFRTVNTRPSVDKGCEGGLLVVSNPSANNGKDINELIKLDGGTYQRFAVFSLGNKQWKASDLMFGSYFLDAETGNEIAAEFYDTTYIPNLRVVKHTYHVWFDSNGGEGSMSMVTLNNKNYKLPPCDITAPTGMKFKGWAVNSADSDDIYHTGENFVLKGDTVLYAAWKKNVIDEVKINTTEPAAGNYIGDQEISILTDDSSLSIYAHEWYESEEKLTTFETFESGKTYRLKVRIATAKSFTNDAKVYVNGEEATVSSCDGSSILFYYDFTLPSYGYTITFGADGGTGEMASVPNASGEYTLPVCRFAAPRGKQFKAWKVNGIEKAVGDKIVITVNTTITAVWEEIPLVMLSYHSNGGSGTMVGDMFAVGDTFVLEECEFEAPEGYKFKAWAVGSPNGEQKLPGEEIVVGNELFIYAIWENIPATEYNVIYGAGEGQGSGDIEGNIVASTEYTLKAYDAVGIVAPEGQVFDYWSIRKGTAQSAEVAKKQPGDTIIINDNTYIVAIWKEAPLTEYMYLYSPGEANGSNDFGYVTNGTQITLYTPEFLDFLPIEGFEFDYWSIRVGSAQSAETAQKQPGDTIIINDDTYIIAIWKAIPHTCVGVAESGQGATCTVNGWKDYYRCECGKYYEDANCQTPISDLEAWKVGAGKITAAHSGTPEWTKTATTHAKKYTCCDTFVVETEAHEWNNGVCSECGYVCLHADTNKDHKCDACGLTVGTHEAALGKHTCDYCGKTVTECIDSNKDHKCDTCGEAVGTHVAASGKHTCDYCGKTASECADANDDGKCDICGANYGACVDSNKDHLCDKHGETMGTHEAALGKHTCDYCNKAVTECSDDNKDHKCDTCGEAMGTHVAASGKHTCDYCNKVVTECADGNKDHKCDTCSAAMGTHEAASGKHTCDYCGKTVTECADSDKNHKCDTCSSNMGTHEAASGKHTCDYCTEVVTQCVDSNKDHKCDICGAAMGTHEAATGKHTCDYCGKTVTECADTNSDGKCDTCGANYGECVDSNKDHKCDKHGEAMGTHEAALGKHTCDYCGQTVTECEDANKDHKCDTCETAVGTHQAATGKHTCDYCGKTVTECADSNKDHKCDTCSTAMGTHEAADGKHTCDYCGKTVTECIDSNKDHKCDTCSTAMGTHEAANGKHTCDYCGVAITECVDTNKDHKCDTCGASVGVHNAATGKHTCDYCGKTVTECTDSSEDDDSKCDICGKDIGDCVDANKDHKCDKHDENMGVHEAALGKHTCDYCGKTVTECEDANKDHKCDTCETAVGTHEAATGKHTCDYCGKTVTECADSDKDHKCDTCSTAMGTHEAANGKHSCDYCGKDVTECSDGNTDGKCDVCQKDLGTVHTHDYGTTWKTDANNHWKECACGKKSELAAHVDNNGDNKCDTCDYAMPAHDPDTPDNPDNPNNTPDNPDNTPDDPSDDKDGLGAGAIVGIVIGSVAVAGVGGFALFWFVIKKKSFADLIAVFKKK